MRLKVFSRDTMPTVEGGICAAVLLVRLAHPNLGGFTAVSGWAIMRFSAREIEWLSYNSAILNG